MTDPKGQAFDLKRESRPRLSERTTRKPSSWWDRAKILLLLLGAWAMMASAVWVNIRDLNPPLTDVLSMAARDYSWLLMLAVLELIRQVHYLIEERSERYYAFWQKGVFGSMNSRVSKIDPWNRYRFTRALKYLFLLFILANILGLIYGTSPVIALIEVPARILRGLGVFWQLSFAFLWIAVQFGAIYYFWTRGGIDVYYPDDIETRFSDVWGQDLVLDRIRENIVFLEAPEEIEKRGGHVPGGILLWGPPGTGKTLMAQAAAGETGVPFVYVEPGGLQMGGILKVKLLYRKLRKLALKYGGSIVFFDEADSLGARAMRGRGDWGMRGPASAMGATCNGLNYLDPTVLAEANRFAKSTDLEEPPIRSHRFFLMGGGMMGGSIHMLLAEMSGLQKPRGFWNRTIRRALGMRPKPPPRYRILHMFATNLPEALDEAMLRPGRIDRKYRVGYPSLEGRKRTFEGYLAKVSHRLTDEEVTKLSVMTPYYGGADVKDLVNEALVTAIRDGRDTIEWSDVVRAKRNKDLGLPEDVEYVERERHAVAIHEACHAVVSYRMMKVANIDLATIEKGAGYLGMVRNVRAEDLYTAWRTDYEASIMTSVASLAGERLFFFADNSSGVSADLENATFIATMMEGFWGMGRTVASHAITGRAGLGGPRPGPERQGKDESPLEGSLGARIEANLEVLLDRTTKLLKENRHEVLALAYALETLKTLDGADVAAVIDGAKGPIVDGRRYHVMEFQEALERYHEAAARAHEEKGSMADLLPELPILPPPMPAAEVEGSGNGQIEVAAVTPSNAASPPRPDPAT